jgi:hypothetical protein
MPSRAETLADQFEAANNETIAQVETCSDAVWKAPTPNDGRTVAAVAYHIADGHTGILGLVQSLANGEPLRRITPEQLDQGNAQQAELHANANKAEVVQALRQNGANAAGAVRGLSDEQLDRSGAFAGSEWSCQQMIERVLIGHVRDHLGTIRAAG